MDPRVVVSNNQQRSKTGKGRVFTYRTLQLRELEDSHPQSFASLVELFEPIGDNFLRKLNDKNWSSSGTYISNVIVFADDRERDVLYKYFLEQGELFRRDLFGFSFDDDHVHIIHSCAFSSSQCKCYWKKEIPCGTLRPGYKYRSKLGEWRRRNFLGAVLYFFFSKGGPKDAWIEGRRQRLEDSLEGVQWQEVEEKVRELLGPLEDETGSDLRRDESDEEFSGPSNSRVKRGHGYEKMEKNKKSRLSKWQIISAQVSELLERTAICPLEGIKSEECFLRNDFLTDPDNAVKVNEAIKHWSFKINNYTLREFYNMYCQSPTFQNSVTVKTSLFDRAFGILESNFDSKDLKSLMERFTLPKPKTQENQLIFSRSKTYYSLEESITVLDRLLRFQFDDDEILIKDFLQNLVNVVDWQPEDNPNSCVKRNTFLVHSPPSAGKNFFFDTLFTLCLNLGQLGTANKSNNFAFQDAANRRIILWNEPNYESGMTDYLKTLFEGGDTKVRIKMMGDTHVKRTPIIILTNNHVNFMTDIEFQSMN